MNMQSYLKQLQELEIEILEAIDNTCEKLDISYIIISGTLLGAIRHKGFIPWDDDIDIGMTRNDFFLFLKNGQKYLPNHLFIQHYTTEPNDNKIYIKVRNKDTLFIENDTEDINICHGIFVDIFPFDKCKKGKYNTKIEYYRRKKYNTLVQCYSKKTVMSIINPVKRGIANIIHRTYCRVVPLQNVLKKEENRRIKLDSKGDDCYLLNQFIWNGSGNYKELFDKQKYEFEGRSFWGPTNYDSILKKYYGDYMKIPDPDEQVTHMPSRIEFDINKQHRDRQLLKNFEDEIICGFNVSAKMKKVWNIQLEIFEQVKEICEKYSIRYYAVAGTLLGAIRHNGYIPWDDDLDIGMPRKDYNRFFKVVNDEINYPYFVQTFLNEPSFPYDMIKIRNSRTTGCTPWEIHTNCNRGIFIDIFPIDNEPDNEIELVKENRRNKKLLYRASLLSRETESSGKVCIQKVKNKIKKFAFSLPFLNKFKCYYIKQVINCCKKHNSKQTSYCGMRSFSNPQKFRWKNIDCEVLEDHIFCNTSIKIPQGYENILTNVYGDWEKYIIGDSFHEGTIYEPNVPYFEYFLNKKEKYS